MKKKVLIWMCVLTALAGLINALAVHLFSMTVSHMTGVITNVVVSTLEGVFSDVWWLFSIVGSFLIGAIVSAFITGDRNFYIKPVYGYIVIGIGILLATGVHVLNINGRWIIRLFAFLMGAQNAMIISFKGVLVRMTHMTGYITDLGVYIGYKLRGVRKENHWVGLVPFCGLVMFILGGLLGLWMFSKIGLATYDVTSIMYVFLGIVYLIKEKNSNDRNLNGIPDDCEKIYENR